MQASVDGLDRAGGGGQDAIQVEAGDVADAVNGEVGGGVAGEDPGIEGVVPLARKDGGQTLAPMGFDGGQDPQLIVDQDVVAGRVAGLDVVELFFFVDVDEDVAVDG